MCVSQGGEEGIEGEGGRVSKILDTHACRLVEGVVKLRLHSDLSVRVGVDEREPQVGVVSTPKPEKKKINHSSRAEIGRKGKRKQLLSQS